MIHSSSIRVHQHAANAKKKDGRCRCIGRLCDGMTARIDALVDTLGLQILLKLAESQAHDGRQPTTCWSVFGEGDVPLAERGSWACVKPMTNAKNIPPFGSLLYRYRDLFEHFFNKIICLRPVATLFCKRDYNFLASAQLAEMRN